MPLYEYKCKKCERTFERLVLHDWDEVLCPNCFSKSVEKLMSPFSYDIADAICGQIPKGERREYCMECRHAGAGRPVAA